MTRLLFCVLALLIGFPAFAVSPKRKPNVLFIAVDDLRPELGTYGHKLVRSPHIDQLASEGLQFNRAYCQLALCNPSRASLLSGRRPETLRIYDLPKFVRDGNPDVVTLPELFKKNGYRSVRFGKIFHATNGNHEDPKSWSETVKANTSLSTAPVAKKAASKKTERDHEETLPYGAPDVADEALSDGKVAAGAIAALKEYQNEPLFLAVGFHKPHLPFVAPRKYWDLYDPKKIAIASNRFHPKDAPLFASNNSSELRRYKDVPPKGPISDDLTLKLTHGYYASVSYVDAQVGKLLAQLDALGLRENTIVILWGDHGYQLGEHGTWNKRTNWEIATRVPLIISAPSQAARGKKTDALVELVDMYPTLVELCGLPLPPKIEGTSFVPLLQNPERKWKSAAFSIYMNKIPELGAGDSFGRAMRTDRYRLIEWSATGNKKRVYELYDHSKDPQENVNIADLPENKMLISTLAKELQAGWRGALPK